MPVQGEAEVEVTRTFTCTSKDGWTDGLDESKYVVAHGKSHADITDDYENHFYVGQYYFADMYRVFRSFIYFDTSSIPEMTNITEVKLGMWIYADFSSTDFNITVQTGQPNYPHSTLESGDYYHIHYAGDAGRISTSGLVTGYSNITFNEDGRSWITGDGITKLCLRSSRDISITTPTTNEYVNIYSAEMGEDHGPLLYVTYIAEVYRYIVRGPYYENGNVFLGIINVTLTIENMASYSFILNGTSGTAGDETIDVEQQGIAFTWNISSTDQNKTRTYSLLTGPFEEIYFFIPDAGEPINIYTFTIIDFYGVTNGYLETLINFEGTNRVVERQSLQVISDMPFWMSWSHSYTIRITCDEGSYTWGGFTALSEYTQNLIVTSGMFTISFTGTNCTVTATRENSTWIQISYTDHQQITGLVTFTISYHEGYTWFTAYTTNATGSIHTVDWYDAVATVDYVVTVTANRGGITQSWKFNIPRFGESTNPWEGLLDILGDWPVPASNVFGLCIVLAVFAAFSYQTSEAGTILAVLTAMMLTYIGWLQISWALLSLAFVIGIFAVIKKQKKQEPFGT